MRQEMLCSFTLLLTREISLYVALENKHKLPSLSIRKYIHLLPIHISISQTPNTQVKGESMLSFYIWSLKLEHQIAYSYTSMIANCSL